MENLRRKKKNLRSTKLCRFLLFSEFDNLVFSLSFIKMTGAWMYGDAAKGVGRRGSNTSTSTGRGRGSTMTGRRGSGSSSAAAAHAPPLQNRFSRHLSTQTSTATTALSPSAAAASASSAAAPPVLAILFDMDGVLTMSEEISRLCGSRVMQKLYGFSE